MVPQKLRFMILKHLAATPLSGYGLTKKIEETTGWKPSYGSMYPQLEQLKNEGLVTFKEEGKKKIYSLTTEGKHAIKDVDKTELINKIRENLNAVAHVMGMNMQSHEEMMTLFLNGLQQGDSGFKEFEDPSVRLKMAFLKLYKEGKLKKNKKLVTDIMNEAAEKMEKLL